MKVDRSIAVGYSAGGQTRAAVREDVSPSQASGWQDLTNGPTYSRVKDRWKHLYRAVDKAVRTSDFFVRAEPDKVAARRFFE
ncbi:DDE-type integrase/transposase/recombinase [Paraburkholderia polaris]|uniref:DDE-type integrase/transposase/recombinase n=1 Tax=Paraburkholderia polaris TaxID=2728848 RepID=UPI0038B31497